MYRSFSDRVLGGVCGGLAVDLRVSAWLLRMLFVLLTVVSLGVGALLYAALWWIMPQESLIRDRSGSFPRFFMAALVSLLVMGAWTAHIMGGLRSSSGQPMFVPVVLLVISVVFFLRQVRG